MIKINEKVKWGILIILLLIIISIGIILFTFEEVVEEQVGIKEEIEQEAAYISKDGSLSELEETYEKCKKSYDPFCEAVVSMDQEKCNLIKDEKYYPYTLFVELDIDTEISDCKNYITMIKIFLENKQNCNGVGSDSKSACEEMLKLKDLSDGALNNYCNKNCSITYYFVKALKTNNAEACNLISETRQKNICKSAITKTYNFCNTDCDEVYQKIVVQ